VALGAAASALARTKIKLALDSAALARQLAKLELLVVALLEGLVLLPTPQEEVVSSATQETRQTPLLVEVVCIIIPHLDSFNRREPHPLNLYIYICSIKRQLH
jgi:hypothetical protein